jgi:hypothetical protein
LLSRPCNKKEEEGKEGGIREGLIVIVDWQVLQMLMEISL